jgi:TonB family protein
MSNNPPSHDVPNLTAGHVQVRLEDRHPVEVPFLFEQPAKRMGPAMVASWLAHIAAFALIVVMIRYTPARTVETPPEEMTVRDIVWLNEPGPGGGGGGGGNRMKEPPRKAELPGKDKITVPVEKPQPLQPPKEEVKEEPPPPVQELNIPAKTMGAATDTLPGVIEGTSTSSLSQGPGSGGGSGTGNGTGIGPGTGSGLGPGWSGGFGGGAYRPGSGIDLPVVLKEVKPQYTAEAMRAKIQGVVVVECVVGADGTVSDVRVQRSLDPVYGLDQEAMKAARLWRFIPAKRQGQPVPILVSIELTFTLR